MDDEEAEGAGAVPAPENGVPAPLTVPWYSMRTFAIAAVTMLSLCVLAVLVLTRNGGYQPSQWHGHSKGPFLLGGTTPTTPSYPKKAIFPGTTQWGDPYSNATIPYERSAAFAERILREHPSPSPRPVPRCANHRRWLRRG